MLLVLPFHSGPYLYCFGAVDGAVGMGCMTQRNLQGKECCGQITTFDGATPISGGGDGSFDSAGGDGSFDSAVASDLSSIWTYEQPTNPPRLESSTHSGNSSHEYVDVIGLGVTPSQDIAQRLALYYSRDQGQSPHQKVPSDSRYFTPNEHTQAQPTNTGEGEGLR